MLIVIRPPQPWFSTKTLGCRCVSSHDHAAVLLTLGGPCVMLSPRSTTFGLPPGCAGRAFSRPVPHKMGMPLPRCGANIALIGGPCTMPLRFWWISSKRLASWPAFQAPNSLLPSQSSRSNSNLEEEEEEAR